MHLECLSCGISYPAAVDRETNPNHCPTCNSRINEGKMLPMEAYSSAGDRIREIERRRQEKRERMKKDLAQRMLWRQELIDFVKALGGDSGLPWLDCWLFDDLCEHLTEIASLTQMQVAGVSPRLLVSMPPGHGKSTIAVHRYAAWYLGHNPSHRVIIASHTLDLAKAQSVHCQRVMESLPFRKAFPDVKIDPDKSSAANWGILPVKRDINGKSTVLEGGEVFAVGVKGGITGRRAHLLIVDDAVKDSESAESVGERNKVWNWFNTAARTRAMPSMGTVVIGTRWHEDDIIGRIIEQETDELRQYEEGKRRSPVRKWKNICYKAIATEDEPHRKKGDPLHPERYNLEDLEDMKSVLSHRQWMSLYQQSPYDEDGGYFAVSNIRRFDPVNLDPQSIVCWNSWDLAISLKTESDYTVGVTLAKDHQQNFYLVDLVRGHFTTREIVNAILMQHKKWNCVMSGVEASVIEMTLAPVMHEERMRRQMPEVSIVPIPTKNKDKMVRATALSNLIGQGRFFVPEDSAYPWVPDLIAEFITFPRGKHDDQIDACSHGCNIHSSVPVPKMVNGRVLRPGAKMSALDRMFYGEDYDRRNKRTPRVIGQSVNHRFGMTA